jgi:hypothetical protein
MQILLQIESLLLKPNELDDDCIWEIANTMRWLNQKFKDKFKIERFLFGEIYTNYCQTSPEFIFSLMEELGYDKDNDNDTTSNDDQSSNSLSNSFNNFDTSEPKNSSKPNDNDLIDESTSRKKL